MAAFVHFVGRCTALRCLPCGS